MKSGVEVIVNVWVCVRVRLGTWVSLGVLDGNEGGVAGAGVEQPENNKRLTIRSEKECFMGRVDYNPDHIKSVGKPHKVFVSVTHVPGWG